MNLMHPRSKTSNSVSLDWANEAKTTPSIESNCAKKRIDSTNQRQKGVNQANRQSSLLFFGRQLDLPIGSQVSIKAICILIAFLFSAFTFVTCDNADAQVRRRQFAEYPLPNYYRNIGPRSFYHFGNYRDADRAFRNLYNSGRKEGTQRWLDSAVYSVMRGEIAYQQGRYLDALGHFDIAADLFIFHTTKDSWTARINWTPQPAQFSQSVARRIQQTPWGKTGRRSRYGQFPRTYTHTFGKDQFIQGERGVVRIPGTLGQPVNVFEIFHSMALMIYRRDQILGPLSKINSRSRILRNTLSDGLGVAKAPIPITLYRLLYGISVAGEGEYQKSTEILSETLQINETGQVGATRDHPLTAIALAQMGRNSYEKGEFKDARNFFLEASYSAAGFERYIIWQEAIIGAAKSHNAFEPQVPMPWLEAATLWGRREDIRVSALPFALLQAENAVENGNIKLAQNSLARIADGIRRTDLRRSAFNLRYQLVANTVALISGKTDDYVAFRKNLDLFRTSTLNQFRIKFINDPRTSKLLAAATLEDQLGKLQDDPEEVDWKRDPFVCLSIITGNRTNQLNQVMLTNLKTRDFHSTVINAEKIRRRTFLSALPMGGRLSSIRDLIGKSTAELDVDRIKRQKELQGRFPALNKLLADSEQMERQLRGMPLVPDFEDTKTWKKDMEEWIMTNRAIERLMVNLGVKREFVPMDFPEKPNLDELQNRIPKDSIVLYIQQSGQIYHVMLITKEVIAYQNGINARLVNKELRKLAKAWNLKSYTSKLKITSLVNEDWRETARNLTKLLVPKGTESFWDDYKELVVIPDGQFWYLPFETLPLNDTPDSPLMTDKLAIRYAPMLSIGFSSPEPRRIGRVALYPGKIYPKDDEKRPEDAVLEVEKHLPSTETVQHSDFLPHQLTPLADGLIYWHYFKDRKWPSATIPPIKKKSEIYKAISLSHWNQWPNTGPKLMVVAGGTTAMSEGLSAKNANGNELFFFSTLLFSSGCDSIVLSRWQTGGHTSYDFQTKLAEELAKDVPTADAVRESMKAIREGEVDFVKHPRITKSKKVTELKSTSPLFWASAMTIDTGKWYPPELEPKDEAVIPGLGDPKPAGDKKMDSGSDKKDDKKDSDAGSAEKKKADKSDSNQKDAKTEKKEKDKKDESSSSGDKKEKKEGDS